MKYKVCISVDENTMTRVMEQVRNGRFRNRSHAFEFSINKILEEQNGRTP